MAIWGNSTPGRGNSMCKVSEVGVGLAEKLVFPFPLLLFPLLLLLFLLLELSSSLLLSSSPPPSSSTRPFLAHTALGLCVMEVHLGELPPDGVTPCSGEQASTPGCFMPLCFVLAFPYILRCLPILCPSEKLLFILQNLT